MLMLFSKANEKNDEEYDFNDESDLGTEIDFKDLVAQQLPAYEVCRRFVTALHLVNTFNIDFQVAKRDSSMDFEGDIIRCKLLSKKPPVDFESYRAASLKKDVDKLKNKKKEKESEDLLAIEGREM